MRDVAPDRSFIFGRFASSEASRPGKNQIVPPSVRTSAIDQAMRRRNARAKLITVRSQMTKVPSILSHEKWTQR